MNAFVSRTCLIAWLGFTGCGPVAIGSGIQGLAAEETTNATVVLLFANDGDEALRIRFDGVDADGGAVAFESDAVPPGTLASLELPRAQALRVRAVQTGDDMATAPVTWDFRLEKPASVASVSFGVESAVMSGLEATASAPEKIVLDRLVGDTATAAFARVGGGELAIAPDRTAVHPGGGYAYTARDVGTGMVEVTAYRFDACSGAMQLVETEFGTTPANPRGLAFSGAFTDLDVFVEPLGRMVYVVQRQPGLSISIVSMLPIARDGSLSAPENAVRGLIGDLVFRPDGRRVYTTEDIDDGNGFVLRDFALDSAGRIDFAAAQASMPCVATEGGALALHPSGRVLYAGFTDPASSLVKVGAYFIGDNGGVFQVNRDCGGFETITDLTVDASGLVLYASGNAIGGALRVIRIDLDPVSGALGALATQDLGAVSRLTTTDDPARAGSDPLRQVVYVAVGDRLIPHLRQADGSLQSLPGAPGLDYGSSASARFSRGVRRGCAVTTSR